MGMCTHSNANKEKYNEKTLEKLWDEYLSDECSAIKTNKEKLLAKGAIEKHKIINELLTKEQNEAVKNTLMQYVRFKVLLQKKLSLRDANLPYHFSLKR